MIAYSQWESSTFEMMFNSFKRMHLEFGGLEHFTLSQATYVKGFESTRSVSRLIGRKEDIVKWSQGMFDDHMMNVLSEYVLKKGTSKMYEDTEKQVENARKKGEAWGDIFLALNPKIPQNVLTNAAMELAKLYGFNTMDAGTSFMYGMFSRFQAYQNANPAPQLE